MNKVDKRARVALSWLFSAVLVLQLWGVEAPRALAEALDSAPEETTTQTDVEPPAEEPPAEEDAVQDELVGEQVGEEEAAEVEAEAEAEARPGTQADEQPEEEPAAQVAQATDSEFDYLDLEGNVRTHGAQTLSSLPDEAGVQLTDSGEHGGWYAVDEVRVRSARMTVSGNVNLILLDGTNLGISTGIRVPYGSSLTIWAQSMSDDKSAADATGVLVVSAASENAGIGGDDGEHAGRITINGGHIVAQGGKYAAGIGGGDTGRNSMVEINGGTVEANGGEFAAGIGGGDKANGFVNFSPQVSIHGGMVTARGGDEGAGIGGGNEASTPDVTIDGGTVNATGGETRGCGIGGGDNRSGGKTVIEGTAIVVATGGRYAAGIGGSQYHYGGEITIRGDAQVTAVGGEESAGIGGGSGNPWYWNLVGNSGANTGGNIVIEGNAQVDATGGRYGAGIGGGEYSIGNETTIRGNAHVVARGGEDAPGIGCGDGGSFEEEHGIKAHIKVEDAATVVAVGSGDATAMSATREHMTIGDQELVWYSDAADGNGATMAVRDTRADVFHGHRWVKVEPCTSHVPDAHRSVGAEGHVLQCTYCNVGEFFEPHDYDAKKGNCVVCGHSGGPVPYMGEPGSDDVKTCTEYKDIKDVPDAMGSALTEGWYVVKSSRTFEYRINVVGRVNLILCDDATLTLRDGIRMAPHAATQANDPRLTIWAQSADENGHAGEHTGRLIATSSTFGKAGIGGDTREHGGTVIVYGGNVEATGGDESAGIGGGDEGGNGGDVRVYRGSVTARGGSTYGAGIGGGDKGGGANVLVEGGKVVATGGDDAAGIGSGDHATSGAGIVTIKGTADVTAIGGDEAAGIGSGNEDTGGAGKVYISGNARVKAVGGTWECFSFADSKSGAGIGGGDQVSGGTLYVQDNAYVDAQGGQFSAAIGGGTRAGGGDVHIRGGIVVMRGTTKDRPNKFAGQGYDRSSDGYKWTSDGTFELYDTAKVIRTEAYNDGGETLARRDVVHTGDERIEQCLEPGGLVVRIEPCDHSKIRYVDRGETHRGFCEHCLYTVDQSHDEWIGANGVCGLCGHGGAPIDYVDETHEGLTCIEYTDLSNADKVADAAGMTLTDEWYVLVESRTFANTLQVKGDVNIILCDGMTLTADKGIRVPVGSRLSVWEQAEGTGELVATGASVYDAGVNLGEGETPGEFVVHGGLVRAKGGTLSAGIGSGGYGSKGGIVRVLAGMVVAEGGANTLGTKCSAIGGGLGGTPGTVELYHTARVAYSSEADGAQAVQATKSERVEKCQSHWVKIEPCHQHEDEGAKYVLGQDKSHHVLTCDACNVEALDSSTLEHTFNADHQCVECKHVLYYVSFAPNGGTGSMDTVILEGTEGTEGTEFELPDCAFDAPEGKSFNRWQVGDEFVRAGKSITVTDDIMIMPQWTEPVPYIDADGALRYCDSYQVVDETTTDWLDDWYVVSRDVTIPQEVTADRDVHLILCDGAYLKVSSPDGSSGGIDLAEGYGTDLTIYGQANQTGTLVATTNQPGHAGIGRSSSISWAHTNVVINGGIIHAQGGAGRPGIGCGGGVAYGWPSSVTINGGTVEAIGGAGATDIGSCLTTDADKEVCDVIINGGIVEAVHGGVGSANENSTVTLSWTNLTDSISVSTYVKQPILKKGFQDLNSGDVFSALSSIEQAPFDLNNRVLIPTSVVVVSFDANGGTGTMKPEVWRKGRSYPLPECEFKAPTGMRFAGWQPEGSSWQYEAGSSCGFNENVTLRAVWKKKSCTVQARTADVQYDRGDDVLGGELGGIAVDPSQTSYAPGSTITVRVEPVIGHTCRGIYEGAVFDDHGVLMSYDKDSLHKLDASGACTITVNDDLSLVAINAIDVFLVSFDTRGSYAVREKYVPYNNKITYPGSPYRDDYLFAGWVTESGDPWDFQNDTVVEPMTLYARWYEGLYDVQFDANGGKGDMDVQKVPYDQPTPLAQNRFVLEGYSFAGWNTEADGSGASFADLEDVTNLAGEPGEDKSSVTLYAQWVRDTGTIVIHNSILDGAASDVTSFVLALVGSDGSPLEGEFAGVKFDANGTYSFRLPHDGLAVFAEVPTGASYTVTARPMEGFVTTSSGETGVTSIAASEVRFTSIKKPTTGGGIIVGGEVDSPILTDHAPDFKYTYIVTLSGEGAEEAKGKTYGDLAFDGEGVARVELADGEVARAAGIPANTEYVVSVAEVTLDGIYGYGDCSGESGSIPADEYAVANVVVRRRTAGDLIVGKQVVSDTRVDQNREYGLVVTLGVNSVSGKFGTMEFKDGVATFVLKDGELATASGLPLGIGYTVSQVDYEWIVPSWRGKPYGPTTVEPATVTSVSTRETGALKLEKQVVSNAPSDYDKEFTIVVKLDDPGVGDFEGKKYGNIRFRYGSGEVHLKDGQIEKLVGLPAGVSYHITEKKTDGFKLDYEGQTGTVINETTKVLSTSTRNTCELKVSNTVKPKPTTSGGSFSYTLELGDTGVEGTYGRVTFVGGKATFKVAAGTSLTIPGLPVGFSYKLTPAAASGFVLTGKSGVTGTLESKDNAASFEYTAQRTVKFVSNGGSSVASQTVLHGTKAKKPTNPTKGVWTFGGWYTNEKLTTAYDFGKAVTSSITLYAKWVPTSIAKASISSIPTQAYTGLNVSPKPTVKLGTTTLQQGRDYTVSYKNNAKPGTATVVVTGRGAYKDTRQATFKIVKPSVQYYVHRQSYGWETAWSKKDGASSGTVGQSKRLEGIRIRLANKPVTGSIQYRTHVQNIGWERGWKSDGTMSGTKGQSKRLEAIQIQLTGQMKSKYDVYYRVHAQTFGWMGWAKNGASAGTEGHSKRLEAIQIVLVPKGDKAPGPTANAFRKK